jgi:polar amino acid transport system ATP-binding protein
VSPAKKVTPVSGSTSSPIIHFHKVTKTFGDVVVLRDFELSIAAGEHLALIGPSGSGKSTILRILMTLEDIQAGEVKIDGKLLWRQHGAASTNPPESEVRGIRRKLGMVFQSFNLFPHMSVLWNVADAPFRVLKLSKNDAFARARNLLSLVGLADKENNFPFELSGGQQQRVAIARTLAMRPKILLFDEITSALDPETVGEVLNVVRVLAKEHDFTILIVTHQMGFAREISDRVCFLEGGRIIEQGSPNEIFEAPKNERTQAFLRAVLQA